MDVLKILSESLNLLKKSPKVFIPRFFTTAAYSIYTLLLASLSASIVSGTKDPSAVLPFALASFAALPLLYFLDIVTYAMYPQMVSDLDGGRNPSIRKSLSEALKSIKTVLALTFVIMAFAFFSTALVLPMLLWARYSQTPYLEFLAYGIFFILALVFSVFVFFVVPSSVLDKEGVLKSFKNSARLGLKYKKELVEINLSFSLLAFASIFLVFKVNLEGSPTLMPVLFYILIRLLQAVVYTYLCIANPVAYIRRND